MIDPKYFCDALMARGTNSFYGVPDSLLKDFCAYITDNAQNTICCNEGAAVGMATGHYLASSSIPAVYMQNSGLGNTVNPLLSLADGDVYSIPMILIIGWRGEPAFHDEPQHVKQGKVTLALLDAMRIPYIIMADDNDTLNKQLDYCYKTIEKTSAPVAIVVKKGAFSKYTLKATEAESGAMSRESAIEKIMLHYKDAVFVSTTGMISRELFEERAKHNMAHDKDFLTVGGMGHASSIALSIALEKPSKQVICLDGDGASLMHLGSYTTIGVKKPANLVHIVLNNGAHDSVGGQPTVGHLINLCDIARAAGYQKITKADSEDELQKALSLSGGSLSFIEVTVRKGARSDLGRPTTTPRENKAALMKYLSCE